MFRSSVAAQLEWKDDVITQNEIEAGHIQKLFPVLSVFLAKIMMRK